MSIGTLRLCMINYVKGQVNSTQPAKLRGEVKGPERVIRKIKLFPILGLSNAQPKEVGSENYSAANIGHFLRKRKDASEARTNSPQGTAKNPGE